jgi:hypothetical protein
MTREPLELRHRAAFCHLAAFPLLTSIWLPLVLRKADLEDEFLYCHATGASVYQGVGLLSALAMLLGRKLPYLIWSELESGLILALLGIVALCLLGIYFMGALALAFQAWNGDLFSAPLVSWLLGYERPSEE